MITDANCDGYDKFVRCIEVTDSEVFEKVLTIDPSLNDSTKRDAVQLILCEFVQRHRFTLSPLDFQLEGLDLSLVAGLTAEPKRTRLIVCSECGTRFCELTTSNASSAANS